MVTVFKNIYDKENPHYREVSSILNLIKSGKYKSQIELLRATKEKELRSRYKNDLPSICFSGVFKKRFDKDIEKHSGYVILDFDHVTKLDFFKSVVIKDEYTCAAFVSPSGDGLKVLVKIPPIIEDHEKHYNALMKKYPSLDSTSKNISRVCFISYDPDLYYNPESNVYEEVLESAPVKKTITPISQNTDYKKIAIAIDLIRNSVDGSKHIDLIKAARLTGGFISGGFVDEFEAIQLLQLEINKKNIDDFKGACKTIQDGIEYGKREPIYEKYFETKVKDILKQDVIIEDEPARDVIYLNDVRDRIIYSYDNGTSRGETTYFPVIDERFRMKRGEITLFHGIGNHGKSTMAYQLALIKSIKDGIKWGVFSPENMPEEEFYKDLIHSYVGKSTEKHHVNQMSKIELERGMDFVHEHFYLIYPKNDTPTPEYMNNRFRELIIKHNISGCIIDPYNQLDNDLSKQGSREDQYLSKFLTNCKRFAIEQNAFFWIITHPRGGLQKQGSDYQCPDVYDLAGGAMWNNKMDNIIAIHRPLYSSDKESTAVYFVSQKIKKQKLNGIPGTVLLNYDRFTSRYLQEDGFNPLTPKEPKDNININNRVEPDRDFWDGKQDDNVPF